MTDHPKSPTPATDCQDMADIRREIDRLDRALVALLAERQTYIERAGHIKGSRDRVRDEARIEDVWRKPRNRAYRRTWPKPCGVPWWTALSPTNSMCSTPSNGPQRNSVRALELPFRHSNDETIEFIRHFDLTAQAAVFFDVKRKIQHVLFHIFRRTDFFLPGWIDIKMAGRTGARAAAIGINAGDAVFHGPFHHAAAVFNVNHMLGSTEFDIGNFGHFFPQLNLSC